LGFSVGRNECRKVSHLSDRVAGGWDWPSKQKAYLQETLFTRAHKFLQSRNRSWPLSAVSNLPDIRYVYECQFLIGFSKPHAQPWFLMVQSEWIRTEGCLAPVMLCTCKLVAASSSIHMSPTFSKIVKRHCQTDLKIGIIPSLSYLDFSAKSGTNLLSIWNMAKK
jgi:hypothetical protein